MRIQNKIKSETFTSLFMLFLAICFTIVLAIALHPMAYIMTVFFTMIFVQEIINATKGKEEIKLSNELKAIEFLPDLVIFNYFNPALNFSCSSSEIKEIELSIETNKYYHRNENSGHRRTGRKSGYYTLINNVIINFIKKDGTTFKIEKPPYSDSKQIIFSVIDFARELKNFDYIIQGEATKGFIENLVEEIEYYKVNIKKKPQYTLKDFCNQIFYFFSKLLFYCWGLFFSGVLLFMHFNGQKFEKFLFLIAILFMLVSFIFDLLLLLIKNKGRKKYHG